MKQYVSVYDFRDRFLRSETYKNNFSYDGLTALFEYFEELEAGMGEEIEFDMVAICCDYSEYDSAEEAAEECGYVAVGDDDNDGLDETERSEADRDAAIEWLEDRTTVIRLDKGGVIIQQF